MIFENRKTNLFVLFDGEIEKHTCHYFWGIAYYDGEGNVVRSYQKGECAISDTITSFELQPRFTLQPKLEEKPEGDNAEE